MKKLMVGLMMTFVLSGCMTHRISDVDYVNNMVQYKFDPVVVDTKQMKIDANKWCKSKGFKMSRQVGCEQSIWTGIVKAWFECE